MNDREVLRREANGPLANTALGLIVLLSIALFIAALPLQITGGG
jgi:hypothetical protein